MADGDAVAVSEQIVRYARPSDVRNGTLGGTAFERPEKDHDGLSVCRLGLFSADFDADLGEVRRILGMWRELKRNGRLARLAVADVIAVGMEVQEALCVVENPLPAVDDKPANPAHALIRGLPFKGAPEGEIGGLLAGDLLARKVMALHPAV